MLGNDVQAPMKVMIVPETLWACMPMSFVKCLPIFNTFGPRVVGIGIKAFSREVFFLSRL